LTYWPTDVATIASGGLNALAAAFREAVAAER
jgi:hypothetical protein